MGLAKNIDVTKLEKQWNSFTKTAHIEVDQTGNDAFWEFTVTEGSESQGGHLTYESNGSLNPAHVTIRWGTGSIINYWFGVEDDGSIVSDSTKVAKRKKTSQPFDKMPSAIAAPIKGLLTTVYAGTPY